MFIIKTVQHSRKATGRWCQPDPLKLNNFRADSSYENTLKTGKIPARLLIKFTLNSTLKSLYLSKYRLLSPLGKRQAVASLSFSFLLISRLEVRVLRGSPQSWATGWQCSYWCTWGRQKQIENCYNGICIRSQEGWKTCHILVNSRTRRYCLAPWLLLLRDVFGSEHC